MGVGGGGYRGRRVRQGVVFLHFLLYSRKSVRGRSQLFCQFNTLQLC